MVREKERERADTAPEGSVEERQVLKLMERLVATTKSFLASTDTSGLSWADIGNAYLSPVLCKRWMVSAEDDGRRGS